MRRTNYYYYCCCCVCIGNNVAQSKTRFGIHLIIHICFISTFKRDLEKLSFLTSVWKTKQRFINLIIKNKFPWKMKMVPHLHCWKWHVKWIYASVNRIWLFSCSLPFLSHDIALYGRILLHTNMHLFVEFYSSKCSLYSGILSIALH